VYRWVEHTAELELEIDADSERAVFEQGFEAIRELLGCGPGEPMDPKRVIVQATDRAALLAEWLAELAFLAESEGMVPERLISLKLGRSILEAVVEGSRGDPPHLVKAATYHRLALEPGGSGWRATVVLDV
jgi:SHS2 domain-containing protein